MLSHCRFTASPPYYCNLTAVALKPSICAMGVREADAQRPLRDILAKNMRRLRAAGGLSQEALAYECGINRTYLSGVERIEWKT